MRHRKASLPHVVKSDLVIRAKSKGLTSFAGLELVRQYLSSIGFVDTLRRHLRGVGLDNDFGFVGMILLIIGLLITGARRVRHLSFHSQDPMLQRFCRLLRLPSARTVGRWLRRFTDRRLGALQAVNEEVVERNIRASGVCRMTIDVDGSVVCTGLKVQKAQRGFNPHHRKVPSYYPITAYEAQTGQILRVRNRPGNVHDGKASIGFLRELFEQLERMSEKHTVEFRMDGAFFREDVLRLLSGHAAEFAIKVPFYPWIELKRHIQERSRWHRLNDTVSYFEKSIWLDPWQMSVRVVIYRKKVNHETRKNFQLDMFDPDDGHFEYSAIATNKLLNGINLWYYMNGRGTHEKVYAELKNGFAFDSVPTAHYGANSAWQLFSVLAFNLMHGFQVATTAVPRSPDRKRRAVFCLASIHTLRYKILNRAGHLVCPGGTKTLEVGATQAGSWFLKILSRLARAG